MEVVSWQAVLGSAAMVLRRSPLRPQLRPVSALWLPRRWRLGVMVELRVPDQVGWAATRWPPQPHPALGSQTPQRRLMAVMETYAVSSEMGSPVQMRPGLAAAQ